MTNLELLEKLDQARDLFQSANVHEQHEIEAIRTELRLRGLFSSKQIRPTSMAYESIVAVLFTQMTRTGQKLTVPPTIQSNPHKYSVPTCLPRDLAAAVRLCTQSGGWWGLRLSPYRHSGTGRLRYEP